MGLSKSFTTAFLIIAVVLASYVISISMETPDKCEKHIASMHPMDGYTAFDSIPARVQNKKLVSAIAYRSDNPDKDPVTIVCHFNSMSPDDAIKLKWHEGNTLYDLNASSTHLFFGFF